MASPVLQWRQAGLPGKSAAEMRRIGKTCNTRDFLHRLLAGGKQQPGNFDALMHHIAHGAHAGLPAQYTIEVRGAHARMAGYFPDVQWLVQMKANILRHRLDQRVSQE